MTDPRNLSNEALIEKTSELVKAERKLTLEVLHHLREIERRKLFAELGYASLFEYAVKHLGYNESSAQRRIASMRLLKEMPELESKIEEGKLTLSAVAQAQVYFKREEKIEALTLEDKKEVIERLQGLSTREVERELFSFSSQPEIHLREKVKVVTADIVEMSFFADSDLQELLKKIRGILAHKLKEGTLTEVIELMANEFCVKNDPGRQTRVQQSVAAQKVNSSSRHIPSSEKRAVWRRDGGCCSFVDPKTGRRCGSRTWIQLDHYPTPFAMGGPSTRDNLRLACFQHNALHALKSYGEKKMHAYWRN